MISSERLDECGLQFSHTGDVVTVTLHRPETLNAQTPVMWAALADIGRALPADVRIVVVAGAGRAFSSGLDLAAFRGGTGGAGLAGDIAALPEDLALERIAGYQQAFSWLTRPDIISIAAVQGHAIGAGFQLALACDLRIAADDAEFALPEAMLGLVPDLGGTRTLVRAVGYSRALEIALTGRRVGAAEALQLALVNLVVPPHQLQAATADCIAAIRATGRDTATEIKVLLDGALGRTAQQQLAAEREAQLRRLKDRFGTGD